MQAGATIGPYRVLGEVARGGAGVVLRAVGPQGEPVALKLLLGGERAPAGQRARFQREVEALRRVRHPHVVPLLAAGEAGGVPWVALEWVQGGTLQERLDRQGPLEPGHAVELVEQLCGALAHCHAQGVLHRDVKPHNVLLRALDGAPLLTDFGLTRDVDPSLSGAGLSEPGRFLGTPGYLAPEQARGELQLVGPATDVYGLGALLVALLTGLPPYGTPTSFAAALDAFERAPPRPSAARPELDRGLDEVCLRALERDPRRRTPTPAALLAELAAWGAGGAGGAAPRRRAAGWALGLLAAGAAAGGAVLLARPRGNPSPSRPPAPPPAAVEAPAAPAPAPPAPSGRDAEEALLLLEQGRVLVDQRRWAEASQRFERAMALDPGLAAAWAERGNVRQQQQDLSGARADYDHALTLDPGCRLAWNNRGTLRRAQGDLSGAVEDYARGIEHHPEHANLWLNRGNARKDQGDLGGALVDYTRALELAPEDFAPWAERGTVHAALGDLERALVDYDQALTLMPDDMRTRYNRGNARRLTGDLRGAAADYTRANELAPYDADPLINLGITLITLDENAQALACFDRAVRLVPESASAWTGRGVALHRLGDHENAVTALTRALELDPRLEQAWYVRSASRGALGDQAGAIADLEQALALAPPGSEKAQQMARRLAAARASRAGPPARAALAPR